MALLGGPQNNGKSGTRYGYGCVGQSGSQIVFAKNQSAFPSPQDNNLDIAVAGDEQTCSGSPNTKIATGGNG